MARLLWWSLLIGGTALASGPTRVVFQRGTHGTVQDCYIWESSAGMNGNSDTLYVGLVGAGEKHAYLQVDLAELAPGTKVLDARLVLETQSGATPIRVHEVTAAWAETEPTWATFATAYAPEVVASFTPETGRTWIDLTQVVQKWVSGAPNHGLVFEQDPGLSSTTFNSSDSSTVSLRPALEVLVDTDPLVDAVAPPALEASCGAPLKYSLRAHAPNATAFTLTDGPPTLEVDQATGLLEWTAVSAERGEHPVSVDVADGVRTGTLALTVKVRCSPQLDVGCSAAPGPLMLVALLLAWRRRRARP